MCALLVGRVPTPALRVLQSRGGAWGHVCNTEAAAWQRPVTRTPCRGVESGRPSSVQEVATRAVKQSSVVQEDEDGEDEEEEAELGEEDLFHQQVVTLCPRGARQRTQ